MLKIKHQRTADCVVAGFRWHKNGPGHARRVAAARAVRRRGHAPPRRRHVVVHVGPARGAGRRAGAAARGRARRAIRGGMGRVGRPARRTPPASGCRARRRAGTAARTCRGSRSAPSASPRSPTTTSRATGSATARRSSAGARTSRRPTAATTSSRRRRRTRSPRSSARAGDGVRLGLHRGAAGSPARISRPWIGSDGPSSSASCRTSGDRRPRPTTWGGRPTPTSTRCSTTRGPTSSTSACRRTAPCAIGERLVERGIPFLVEKPLAAADADGPARLAAAIDRRRARRGRRLPLARARPAARDPRRLARAAAAARRRALARRHAAVGLVGPDRPGRRPGHRAGDASLRPRAAPRRRGRGDRRDVDRDPAGIAAGGRAWPTRPRPILRSTAERSATFTDTRRLVDAGHRARRLRTA